MLSIQNVISQTDARLAYLDDGFRNSEKRASLSRYRTGNSAILFSLRRMPTEVLGEIFSWTLPSLDDEWSRGKLDGTESPWTLTRVSSLWRGSLTLNSVVVVAGCHRLWRNSRLCFCVPIVPSRDSNPTFAGFENPFLRLRGLGLWPPDANV
ncbi:hypothetical protein C8R47DRAFT_172233 [Mycena vitilis]|nr:hypothetical protein C8R47DRAFT_172233 [Mycena vitilis]